MACRPTIHSRHLTTWPGGMFGITEESTGGGSTGSHGRRRKPIGHMRSILSKARPTQSTLIVSQESERSLLLLSGSYPLLCSARVSNRRAIVDSEGYE
eukprot:36820-Pelagomonas_calceolata.AAC.4